MSKQNIPETTQFLLYTTEDGKVKIETRLEADTVWLTQTEMAELFQATQQNISLHIQNIFDEGELSAEATHKKYLSVRREGNRDVKRSSTGLLPPILSLPSFRHWNTSPCT